MLGWVVAVAAVTCACSFDHGAAQIDSGTNEGSDGDASNAPWLAGYMRRKPVAIAAPITSTLTDFPVGIIETSDAELAMSARDDGHDLVFTAGDGTTILDHELVRFTGTGGGLEAWVRIPSLTSAPTTIYLYYRGPEHPAAGAATWPSQFAGVWHLGEMTDSTTHHHGAMQPMANRMPAPAEGIAGNARDFDGGDDFLSIGDPGDGSLDFGTSSFSISLWVKVTESAGAFDGPLSKGGTTTGDPGYCMLFGSGDWQVKVHDGAAYHDPIIGAEILGRWVHVAAVLDREMQQLLGYRDGMLAGMDTTANIVSLDSTKPLVLGAADLAAFRGMIDEVRISTGAVTADWINAEHANLATSTFITLGAEQKAP